MVLLLELPFFLESAVFGPVEDDFAIPLTDPDGRLTKIYSHGASPVYVDRSHRIQTHHIPRHGFHLQRYQ